MHWLLITYIYGMNVMVELRFGTAVTEHHLGPPSFHTISIQPIYTILCIIISIAPSFWSHRWQTIYILNLINTPFKRRKTINHTVEPCVESRMSHTQYSNRNRFIICTIFENTLTQKPNTHIHSHTKCHTDIHMN